MREIGAAILTKKPARWAGFVRSRQCASAIELTLSQLCSRCIRILGNDLTQNALRLVPVTQADLNICQLVEGIRHLVVLRIRLAHSSERLTSPLQVALCQVDLAKPVLSVASVLTVRVLAQECRESLAGLVEILRLDQVESSVVIELSFSGSPDALCDWPWLAAAGAELPADAAVLLDGAS